MPAVLEHTQTQPGLFPVSAMPSNGDFRVLVTGWRYWPKECSWVVEDVLWMVYSRIFKARSGRRHMVVVEGACPYGGVDQWAFEWALGVINNIPHPDDNDVVPERIPAYVNDEGRVYGSQRNSKMVNLGANLCLSFPGPTFLKQQGGTFDCTMKAIRAGIPTWTFHWNDAYRSAT